MVNQKNDYSDMEDSVLSPDEIIGNDITIKPDYYIHTALLRAQKSLMKENTKDAFMTYCLFINHIEVLANASGRLPDDYEATVKEYSKSLSNKMDNLVRDTKIANYKLNLMMKQVFNNTVITASLKTG